MNDITYQVLRFAEILGVYICQSFPEKVYRIYSSALAVQLLLRLPDYSKNSSDPQSSQLIERYCEPRVGHLGGKLVSAAMGTNLARFEPPYVLKGLHQCWRAAKARCQCL